VTRPGSAEWSQRDSDELYNVAGHGADAITAGDGARGTRTPDLLGAIQALSQLSYSPEGLSV
jgi:hypothetical protein